MEEKVKPITSYTKGNLAKRNLVKDKLIKDNFAKNKFYLIGLLCIFAVFVITRFWRLTVLPTGFHIDEATIAYNAWCLQEYGVDRYLKSWPIYFINFDGGQSILYTYLCAGLFSLFGYHEILVRLPAVFFSFLTLLFGMLITHRLTKPAASKPFYTLFAGCLIVICPYFIFSSRYGLDCNLMLGASTVFLYFFILALESGKLWQYFLSGFLCGLVLYTYALSYIVVPFFLLFTLLYTIRSKKFRFWNWFVMAIPVAFLAFPLILEQIVNAFQLNEIQLGVFTITRMKAYRASELGTIRWDYIKRAFCHLFLWDDLNYNSLPGTANLYYITIPLFFVGLLHLGKEFVQSVRKRQYDAKHILLLWFLASLLLALHVKTVINKMNYIYFVTIYITTDGFFTLCGLLRPLSKKLVPLLTVFVCCFYAISFLCFGSYYYLGAYTAEHTPLRYFEIVPTEAISFLSAHPEYGPKGTQMSQQPIYYALSTLASPYELQLFDETNIICDNIICSTLGPIEDGYNYIVRDFFTEYAQELRDAGFTEITYTNYSLFYQENH